MLIKVVKSNPVASIVQSLTACNYSNTSLPKLVYVAMWLARCSLLKWPAVVLVENSFKTRLSYANLEKQLNLNLDLKDFVTPSLSFVLGLTKGSNVVYFLDITDRNEYLDALKKLAVYSLSSLNFANPKNRVVIASFSNTFKVNYGLVNDMDKADAQNAISTLTTQKMTSNFNFREIIDSLSSDVFDQELFKDSFLVLFTSDNTLSNDDLEYLATKLPNIRKIVLSVGDRKSYVIFNEKIIAVKEENIPEKLGELEVVIGRNSGR